MVCALSLVRRDDFVSDVDSIDLFANGIELADEGYHPVVAPLGAASVTEAITLKLKGTSKDDLASIVQTIDAKIRQVQYWLDDPGVEKYQVWIRSQLDNESNPRQAMIISIHPPTAIRVYNPTEIQANYIGEYTLGIERTPFWESASTLMTEETHTNIGSVGGMTAFSSPVLGDVSARMVNLNIISNSGGSGDKIFDDFWIGVKTDRFGTPANFVPVWSLASAGWKQTDVTSGAVSGSYSGNALTCTFAHVGAGDGTAYDLYPRAVIEIGDVMGGNYADQRGTYNVLLRAKLSNDTDTILARIAYGYSEGGFIPSPVYRSRAVISGSFWLMYEVGTVKIPPGRTYDGFTLENFAIEVDAERSDPTFTANLILDCLVLIPTDDAFVRMTTNKSHVTASVKLQCYQAADDTCHGYTATGSTVVSPVNFGDSSKWCMPYSSSAAQIVVAAQEWNLSHTANRMNIGLRYIQRYRTLRGAA